MTRLDKLAIALLLLGALVVSQAPMFHPPASIVVVLEQTISDPLDPDMTWGSELDPAFEAWATIQLRKGK